MQTPSWHEAASFAARAHRHQLRRDQRTPYIAHPFRVAMAIRDLFGCEDRDTIAAALLHDTIEDTTTDYDDLLARFGPMVADLVAAMTKNMAMPEPQREREYDARLAVADPRARLIKLADVYDNLIDARSAPPEHRDTQVRDALERCRRAVALAQPDVMNTRDAHDPIRGAMVRALDVLREAAGTM